MWAKFPVCGCRANADKSVFRYSRYLYNSRVRSRQKGSFSKIHFEHLQWLSHLD